MSNNIKIEEKKNEKKNKLLKTSFNLFIEKGIHNTTIQDIVDKAGLAKGTFYLYFKDKYEVQDELIVKQSKKLFDNALNKLDTTIVTKFEDQIIFVIDNILDELTKNILLLKFITKNLSWGLYNEKLSQFVENDTLEIKNLFLEGIQRENIKLENPEVTLYMIIELSSSTCFNSIVNKDPLPIEDFKPFLYSAIRKILSK